jgi:hypothetical protein
MLSFAEGGRHDRVAQAPSVGGVTAMALPEIENQLGAGHLVLRHAPGRTVAFVVIVLISAVFFGLQAAEAVLCPSGILGWFDAFGGLIAAFLAYTGFVVAVQAVRGIPLLEASEAGIAINSPWSTMFVHWRDAAGFYADSPWLRIRLRKGARPVASTLMRIATASSWARRTVSVPAFTTVARAAEIAEALSTLRARYGAT